MALTDRSLGLAYGHAGLRAQAALAGRVSSQTRCAMLRAPQCAPELIATVLRGGELREVALLAQRAELPAEALDRLVRDRRKGVMEVVLQRSDLELSHLEVLVRRDEPEMNAQIFAHPRASEELRARIVSGRPQRRTSDETPIMLHYSVKLALKEAANLSLALGSDDREVLAGCLANLGSATFAQQLELAEKLLARNSASALRGAARQGEFHPLIRAVLALLPDPHSSGVSARAVCEGGIQALRELRERGESEIEVSLDPVVVATTPGGELSVLRGATTLPWEALGEVVLAERCTEAAWEVLSRRADFDEELLCQLARSAPGRAAKVRRGSREAVRAALEAPIAADRWMHSPLQSFLRTQYGLGALEVADLLACAHPAAVGLELAAQVDRSWWEDQAPQVGAALAAGLGEEHVAWMSFHELLPEFAGSIHELIETATALHS